MRNEVEITPCQRYRYVLKRIWDSALPHVLLIGLNPSTADADHDDPTLRRYFRFAHKWGYGGLTIGNLFAYRATRPAEQRRVDDPIGTENDEWIARLAASSSYIVAAWSIHGSLKDHAKAVAAKLPVLHCIGVTKHSYPRHPLMCREIAFLQDFSTHFEGC